MSAPSALEACQRALDWLALQSDYLSSQESVRFDALRNILAEPLSDKDAREELRTAKAWRERCERAEATVETLKLEYARAKETTRHIARRRTALLDAIHEHTGVGRSSQEIANDDDRSYARRAFAAMKPTPVRERLARVLEALARRLR